MYIRSLVVSFIYILGYSSINLADTITAHNTTDTDLFIRPFYVKSNAAQAGSILKIQANSSIALPRPSRKLSYDRELSFSTSSPKDTFDSGEFKLVPHTNIGDTQGSNFYIARDQGVLKGYNTAEWKVMQPFLKGLKQIKGKISEVLSVSLKERIKNQFRAIRENPYKDRVAQVRIGNELHAQERAYLQKRKPNVKEALEKFLQRKLSDDQVPVCAIVASGGGYRALVCCLGWLAGFESIGLLDTMTYMVGLSGSTWAFGQWTTSGLSVKQFKETILKKLQSGLEQVSPEEFKMIVTALLVKAAFDQPLTTIDIFGGLIANALLRDQGINRQRVYLSQQTERIKDGKWIFPIYTAVRADTRQKQDWFEFTPFEGGAAWLGMYVPIWGFGRKFVAGQSIDFAPEQSFGFLLGTFGSAFAATFNKIYAVAKEDMSEIQPPFNRVVEAILEQIGEQRITNAVVFNFMYGFKNSSMAGPITFGLADAGVEFNLPYPAISGERPERKADVIFFFDASAGSIGKNLRNVEQYAHARGLKFPAIDYDYLAKHSVAIFKDEKDPMVPLVIYIWRSIDKEVLEKAQKETIFKEFTDALKGFDIESCVKKDFCSTYNFKYAEKQTRQLSAMTEFTIVAHKDLIIQAINWKVDQMGSHK